MAWHVHPTPTAYDEIKKIFDRTVATIYGSGHIYRGQSDEKWQLTPSIARIMRDRGIGLDQAIILEREAIEFFKYEVEGSSEWAQPPAPTNDWEWWALMQHFGAPTCLLDWSESYFVALYFAVKDHWNKDGAMWYVDKTLLQDMCMFAMEKYSLVLMPLLSKNERISVQKGWFTGGSNPLELHDDKIDKILGWMPSNAFSVPTAYLKYQAYGKVIIPSGLKPEIFERLVNRRTSGSTLFPGLDGIGRSIADIMQLECNSRRGYPADFEQWKKTGIRQDPAELWRKRALI